MVEIGYEFGRGVGLGWDRALEVIEERGLQGGSYFSETSLDLAGDHPMFRFGVRSATRPWQPAQLPSLLGWMIAR